MWTTANRLNYKRDNLRYPSDLTGEEWAHIEALIPPAKHGGRKRKVDVREVVNGIMYVLSTGCQWRYVPKDLPPKSTLYDYFDLWTYDGTLETIHHALYVRCREQIGREASPTAAIIDSQSVKSAEKGGLASPPTAMMRAKNQRQEAAHSRRHFGPFASCPRASGGYSRSRRRRGGFVNLVWHVPISRKALRRWRLPRAGFSKGGCQGVAPPKNRNCEAIGSGKRLRGFTTAVGRRTHLRLAQSLSPPGQGF
jgi:transposase